LSLAWNKGDWSLQLSMNEKMHRPSYRSLQNYMQYDNRYMYEGGNPALRPEKLYSTEAQLTYRWVSMTLGYKYYDDAIVWLKRVMDDEAVTYTTDMNFDHRQTLYSSLYLSPRFGKYRPTLEIDYDQQLFNTLEYGSSKKLNKPSFGISLNNRYMFSQTLMGTLNISAGTRSYNGFQMMRERFNMSVMLRKSFNKERWVLTLSADDIFKTARERWTMYGIGAESSKDCYNYNRNISLRVTYNFNNTRTKYKGTGAGNDEKKRM
jgi:hypothetical protein